MRIKVYDICLKTVAVAIAAIFIAAGIRIVIQMLDPNTYPYLLEIKLK